MTTIRQPAITVNKLPAVLPAALEDQKILIIGQYLGTGSATTGIVETNIIEQNINIKFGEKSMIAEQLRQAFQILKESGSAKIPRIDALPFADAGGAAAAQGIIGITESGGATGFATTAGSVIIVIGSQQRYSIEYNWALGDAFSSILAGVAAAINATTCPVTATVNTTNIEIDFNQGGTVGNNIGLGFAIGTADGVSNIIGNVQFALTGFTGGSGDPASADVVTALDLIIARYQTICAPSQWAVSDVETFLNNRFNVDNEILDGVCITHKIDTVSNLITYAGTTTNSQSVVVIAGTNLASTVFDSFPMTLPYSLSPAFTYDGPLYREFDFCIPVHVGVVRALRRTEDANLIRYVLNGQNLDLLGGAELASLPYHNTPLYNIDVADSSLGFSKTEVSQLTTGGVTVIGNNIVNALVLLGSTVTTYKTNAQGQADATWHFLNTVDTVSVAAEYIFNSFKRDYVQTRLTTGNLRAGRGMSNAESILASMKQYYLELADLLIVRDSKEDIKFFLNSITLNINLLTGSAVIGANIPIVVQLRTIIASLITTFETN